MSEGSVGLRRKDLFSVKRKSVLNPNSIYGCDKGCVCFYE